MKEWTIYLYGKEGEHQHAHQVWDLRKYVANAVAINWTTLLLLVVIVQICSTFSFILSSITFFFIFFFFFFLILGFLLTLDYFIHFDSVAY